MTSSVLPTLLPTLLPAALALLVLAALFLRLVGSRATFSHWQNLNDLDGGRVGSALRHGRAWLHIRENRPAGGSCVSVEWSFLRWSHLGVGVEAREYQEFAWSVGLGFASLHLSLASPFLHRFMPDEDRSFRLAFHDAAIWLQVWGPSMSWASGDPWWKRGVSFHYIDFFLGEPEYSKRELASTPALIPMPERAYRATVTIEEATWKRPRWPIPKRMIVADIEMEKGEQIPTPGKGENSWDCDEDATFSLSTKASSAPEAIAAMVESVLRRRERYGGIEWRPEGAREP